jgi:hypothetical protein
MCGPRDSYYFGLFLAASTNTFIPYFFTGIYATNTGVDGLFSGGTVAVPGWLPGTATNFFVAGWSRSYNGHDFQPQWFAGQYVGDIGVSPDGAGIAGNGSTIPPLNVFNGGSGTIQEVLWLFNGLGTSLGGPGVRPPPLQVSRAGTNIVFTWPTNPFGWILATTSNCNCSANWTTNLPPPVVVSGQNTVYIPLLAQQQFFTLGLPFYFPSN